MTAGIGNLSNINSQGPTVPTEDKSTLDKDDFLKLMLEQLKHQDPMNPLESNEYAAQLAQFTSVEQLGQMSSSLDQMIDANYQLTQSITNSLSAAFIGKDAKISGGEFTYTDQGEMQLGYELPSSASELTMNIYDSSGVLVKSYTDLQRSAGDHKLSWDFTDNNGNDVSPGDYRFEVSAAAASGESIQTNIYKIGRIDGIRFGDKGTNVIVGGGEYSVTMVSEILEQTSGESEE